jgi:3-hydroxyacyl-[acyl-carrier-protein] dehydratase
LVDFATTDLSKVIYPKAAVFELLRQRGRFEMLDGIVVLDPERELVVGFKDVREDDWWAPDHIPGRPLFPGALMIEGAAQLVTFDFLKRRPEMVEHFLGFGGLDKTRFRATVEPNCRLYFAGKLQRVRSRMFTYYAQALVDGVVVFESEILGLVV